MQAILPVAGLTGAIAITTGAKFSCALLAAGEAYCWGDNTKGQLASGALADGTSLALVVPGLENAKQIVAGAYHTCALHGQGVVSCWGQNSSAQLGNFELGLDRPTPVEVSGLSDVQQIAAGHLHTCALHGAGQISCWGGNLDGQVGSTDEPVAAPESVVLQSDQSIYIPASVAAGGYHTCAITTDSKVFCWGRNSDGQLGRDFISSHEPVPDHAVGLPAVKRIALGRSHTCVASFLNGDVACWGANSTGQLGRGMLGESEPKYAFINLPGTVNIVAGSSHTCAQTLQAGVRKNYCWGNDDAGQVGNGQPTSPVPTPFNVLNPIGANIHLRAGFSSTCLTNQLPKCWGDNSSMQLGTAAGSTHNAPVDAPEQGASDIAFGERHSCSIDEDARVTCLGDSYFGQLGSGELGYSGLPIPVGSIFHNGFD